jgi:hypothetical protein
MAAVRTAPPGRIAYGRMFDSSRDRCQGSKMSWWQFLVFETAASYNLLHGRRRFLSAWPERDAAIGGNLSNDCLHIYSLAVVDMS